jgi:hypothetical protein
MEVPKDTACIEILYKQKCHFFYFTKLENMRVEQVLSGGLVGVGEGRMWGKSVGG